MVSTAAEHSAPPPPTHFRDPHTEAPGSVGGGSQLRPSPSEAVYVQSSKQPQVVGFTVEGTEA